MAKQSDKKHKRANLVKFKRLPTPSCPVEARIIALLEAKDYVPLNYAELAKALALKEHEEALLTTALNALIERGYIARIKHDRYCLPKDADLVIGVIRFRQSGSAVVIPENTEDNVYQIAAEDTGVALHEDRVLIRKKSLSRREQSKLVDGQVSGQVVRILKRARPNINGTLQARRNVYYVIPDDPRIAQDILVPIPTPEEEAPMAVIGDKVIVRLLEWENRHLNPVGEIIEVLGASHTPDAEYQGLLRKYDLSADFPEAVKAEAATIPSKVEASVLGNRLDCRNIFTLTIDPVDAKDFDDALSFEVLPDGNWRVGIHIADVAHYVQPRSALDEEARRRGNSTYLVGTVIPMLPHALSSGICSLLEGEDRLTKCVFFTFTPLGKLLDTTFANTVICSDKRLSYPQAFAFLKEDNLDALHNLPTPPAHQTGAAGRPLIELSDEALCQIKDTLRKLWQIAAHLRQTRFKKGSLDLEMPEVKIYVDPQGYADRIERILYDESHQLIEEFMLLANEAVAKALFHDHIAFLSRVHDEPDAEKLDEYRDFLSLFKIFVGDLSNRNEVTHLLSLLKDHPQGHTLRLQFLKSLKQACYRPKNDGHYGLNKTFYTHFTSPIRRYTDLSIHRLFDYYLQKRGLPTASAELPKLVYTQGILTQLGEHLSQTERLSSEAERESVRIKLLEFFERETKKQIRTHFRATIIDIKNIGLFIELTDSLAFGLVHISYLKDDLYTLTANGTALVGRRTKNRYALGQEIEVTVEKVNRFKRQIDFGLAPTEGTPSRKQQRKSRFMKIDK